MEVSGEGYVQSILDQLNGIEVRGEGNMRRLLYAIHLLEKLKTDIVTHKNSEPAEKV